MTRKKKVTRPKRTKAKAKSKGQTGHTRRMKALKKKVDAKVRSSRDKRALLIVNTGDGKGKSTAGFGIAFRAAPACG